MRYPMIGIDSTVDEYGIEFTRGEHVDSFFVCWSFNFLEVPRRYFTAFELVSLNPYLWLMLAKDAAVTYELPDEQILVAEYGPDDNSPFHRLYCYRLSFQGAAPREALVAQLGRTVKTISFPEIAGRYGAHATVASVEKWIVALKKALQPTTRVAEGRIENTTVEKTVILYRQAAGCVICGQSATNFVGSTVGYGQSMLYIANTCAAHQEVAKTHPSVLHFVFSLFQIGLDLGKVIKFERIPDPVIEAIISEVISGLGVVHEKSIKNGEETTLTFFRDSGFRVILRLNTLMDYGYMIDKPDGTPYRRIDSAPDHPDIFFFPDHIHFKPKKDNSDVASSFTYGFPLLDLPVVKKLVEEGEAELEKEPARRHPPDRIKYGDSHQIE